MQVAKLPHTKILIINNEVIDVFGQGATQDDSQSENRGYDFRSFNTVVASKSVSYISIIFDYLCIC